MFASDVVFFMKALIWVHERCTWVYVFHSQRGVPTVATQHSIPLLLQGLIVRLQGIQNIPSQRVTDLKASIRQLRQISCIRDGSTISASYEVSQAQKALYCCRIQLKGASTSSEELNAQISPRTDDEHNLPCHEDDLQEH